MGTGFSSLGVVWGDPPPRPAAPNPSQGAAERAQGVVGWPGSLRPGRVRDTCSGSEGAHFLPSGTLLRAEISGGVGEAQGVPLLQTGGGDSGRGGTAHNPFPAEGAATSVRPHPASGTGKLGSEAARASGAPGRPGTCYPFPSRRRDGWAGRFQPQTHLPAASVTHRAASGAGPAARRALWGRGGGGARGADPAEAPPRGRRSKDATEQARPAAVAAAAAADDHPSPEPPLQPPFARGPR